MRLKLKEARQRKFMTQQELADAMGTTKANISRLENGRQTPFPSTIKRLAVALGVAPDDLVDWNDDEETGKAAA